MAGINGRGGDKEGCWAPESSSHIGDKVISWSKLLVGDDRLGHHHYRLVQVVQCVDCFWMLMMKLSR
jgi:hypothetical protein